MGCPALAPHSQGDFDGSLDEALFYARISGIVGREDAINAYRVITPDGPRYRIDFNFPEFTFTSREVDTLEDAIRVIEIVQDAWTVLTCDG